MKRARELVEAFALGVLVASVCVVAAARLSWWLAK